MMDFPQEEGFARDAGIEDHLWSLSRTALRILMISTPRNEPRPSL
jgi:hypothetical protein